MTKSLPPGLWDNPTPHEKKSYQEFLMAWFSDEESYRQHFQQWVAEEELGKEVLSVRMLAYDVCGTCNPAGGTDIKEGAIAVLSPLNDNTSDIGTTTYYTYGESSPSGKPTCGLFGFGNSYAQPLMEGINLAQDKMALLPKPDIPLMKPAPPRALANQSGTVTALLGETSYPGWLKFDKSEIPEGTINYAFLRIWPLENYVGDPLQADICITLASLLPTDIDCDTFIELLDLDSYQWGKLWTSVPLTWSIGVPVDTTNIACLVEEAKSLSNFQFLVTPQLLGYSSYRLASSVELYIYYDEVYSRGGVLTGGKAKYEDIGGVIVGGTADETVYWQPETRGGALVEGRPALHLQYRGTGGVVVQRPTVELHLDCETPDNTVVEDVSSWERDATLVNMDSSNFVDARTGKVLDFDIEV